MARDEQPIFQGLVHSVAALLDTRAFAQRPGVSLPKRNTLELSRELKILETNVHLTQCLLDEANTAAAVLVEGIDRYEHTTGAIAGSYCFQCAPTWIQNSQIFESL